MLHLLLTGEDERSSTVVKKKKKVPTQSIIQMDTSTEEQVSSKDEDTFEWLRDCFKDLLTTNS